MPDLQIRKKVWIKASPEAVYDALTSAEQIVRYFPLDKVSSSWQVGNELRMDGTATGQAFTDHGVIRALDRPETFAYTYWSDNHGTENHPDHHVYIEYKMYPEDDGTRVTMVQSNLPSRDLWAIMGQVWDGLLESLKIHIDSRFRVS